jgi:LPS O-antigen subunit length determinant protein (WzzB/FepE family)
MAVTLNTDVESLAQRLSVSLQSSLQEAIRAKLMNEAAVIVSDLAREMAQSLHGKVSMYRDHMQDRVHVALVLDGVSELVPPRDETKA